MKFVGTVIFAKRQGGALGSPSVTDIRLDGRIEKHDVLLEISVPTSRAGAYPVGRRVVLWIKPV